MKKTINKTQIFFSLIFLFITNYSFAGQFETKKIEGNDLFKNKEYPEACSIYQQALPLAQSNMDRAIIHTNIGHCYRLMILTEQALFNYHTASLYNPKTEKPYYWMLKIISSNDKDFYLSTPIASQNSLLLNALKNAENTANIKSVLARSQMEKNGSWVAPGVSYVPEFLDENLANELVNMYKHNDWSPDSSGNVFSEFNFLPCWYNYERVLKSIFEKIEELHLLPKGVEEFNFINLKYPKGGGLEQHKDHKARSDHFVLGISVTGNCKFKFIRDKDKQETSLNLEERSLYITEGKFHDICTHGIESVETERYALIIYVPSPEDKTERFNIKTKKLTSEYVYFQRKTL